MAKKHLSSHDRYIRSVMSHLPVACEVFKKHLPTEVVKTVDFSTMKLEKDSFINDKLKLKVADLLYSVNFNDEPGYLYLLVEHASKPERFLPYRMFHYTLSIMDQHLEKTKEEKVPKQLPLVVPLILYTGQKPYTCSTDFFDLFGKEKDLAKSIFLRPFELVDINKMPDKTLREIYYWFGAAALTAKHIRDSDLVSLLKSMVDLLERLKKEGFDDYVHITLSYIFKAGDVKDEEGFRKVIRSELSSEDEEVVMTLAEKYRQKGKLEGKLEGELKALHKMALKFLNRGMSADQVAEMTELSLEEVQKLKSTIKIVA